MQENSYVKQIIELNKTHLDRYEFHKHAGELLKKMGGNTNFWKEVFETNLSNTGFLQRKWSMYEIPFFYIYECDDFFLKTHLFVPLQSGANNIAASAIHHHNNYLLSTFAAFGSGYETFLFEKEFLVNTNSKHANLKIRTRFTQKEKPLHMVDAWEPHVVINPTTLSCTLVMWSPDKKRVTDSLRSNSLLKLLKLPLRKLIYLFGLDKKIGIAAKETYQFYTHENKFIGISEEEFFAPTKLQVGETVDNYSVQTLFNFMQKMNYKNDDFLFAMKKNANVPHYYHQWIDKYIANEPIGETYAKEKINIPNGVMTIEDILNASKA